MANTNDEHENVTDLFTQFSPSLHFDAPLEREGYGEVNVCYTIAEQSLPADRHTFWNTIRRWTLEPQYAIPPIEKADIKQTLQSQAEGQPFETIERVLIPKRKSKDTAFSEHVQYFESDDNEYYHGRVVYRPIMSDMALPFYYPKVQAYSFVYVAQKQEEEERGGTLRLDIVPLAGSHAVVSDTKMWCIQARIGYKKKAHHDVLIPKDTYLNMYQHVKSTYATKLINDWTEKTDPKKFVFEDIAIASYLICLWQEEEKRTKRKPRFVDLACGNGLLTYLLTSEGYEGFGVDMAERKIWSMLSEGKTDILRVETLYPAQISYPGSDWLIGNHADELVPWIPIIASKSGDQCNFLVIPCCFYALDGTRSLALRNEEGKYRAYTDYIKDLATTAGFICEEDYLRIPSTKNIAIVGRQRQNQVNPETWQKIEAAGLAFVPHATTHDYPTVHDKLTAPTNYHNGKANYYKPLSNSNNNVTLSDYYHHTTTVPLSTTNQQSTRPNTSTTTGSSTTRSDATASSSSSSSDSSSTASPTSTPGGSTSSDSNTGTIAGAVVGGVVGVALIGGALTFLNRRGGCARRSEKRTADFEDFGLAETDFPHHRSPPMAPSGLAAAGAGGAAAAAVAGTAAAAGGAKGSPTLPRLNDQGNYYDPAGHQYVPASYQPQLDMNQAEYGDYAPQHPGGAGGMMAAQQGYYYPQQQHHDGGYPQQQHHEGGYYDEQGYYYDGSTAVPSPAGYDHAQQPQHQQGYPPAPPPGDYYKPDQVDAKPHERT
ncbi:tRNA methyltransferase 44 [Apophysomyces sp. BC1015]|nr:tRNA methyltransferase 44 [Apophysomyces sp. BC1015]